MPTEPKMTRRGFVASLVPSLGLAAGALTFLNSCGSNDTGSGGGSCGTTYTNSGHAHTTQALSDDQLNAAVPGNYTMMGGAHSHTFTLTAADFTTLKSRGQVNKTDNEGDGYIIRITC